MVDGVIEKIRRVAGTHRGTYVASWLALTTIR
jgi:hypothetical protein